MDKVSAQIIKHFRVFSKMTAALVIAVYICGFLIVSLHHASFGFFETNPLKSRIVTAGALFLFFSFLPLIPIERVFRDKNNWDLGWEKIGGLASAALTYLLTCGLITIPFDMIYVKKPGSLGDWKWSDPSVYFLIIGIFLTLVAAIINKYYFSYLNRPKTITVIYCSALISVLTGLAFWINSSVQIALTLWFFAVGITWVFFDEILRDPDKNASAQWERVILTLLIPAIAFFSTSIYPRINSSWGGGSPVAATIYLNQTSLMTPTQILRGQILEETNDGIFFIPKIEKRALYLPRENIGGIYFSQKPLNLKEAAKEPFGPWLSTM